MKKPQIEIENEHLILFSEDEHFLVESGLLKLLDELCALQTLEVDVTECKTLEQRAAESGSNSDTAVIKNTTSLAWAAFQVRQSRKLFLNDHFYYFLIPGPRSLLLHLGK